MPSILPHERPEDRASANLDPTSGLGFRDEIHRIGTLLVSEVELDRLVQRLTDEATAVCGAKFGAFFYNIVQPDGESYLLYTLSGASRETFADMGLPRKTALFAP